MLNGQVGLLARHFLLRFLDNDLISPDSDVHDTSTLVLAFLAVPSLLATGLLLMGYANPWVTPHQRLLLALNDKYMYIAWSMLVMAIVTLVEWDALSLDQRDYAVLGILPLTSATLLAGKLVALVLFVAAVVVAVNAVPALFFPVVYLSSVSVSLPLALGPVLMFGHAFACGAAALFGFLIVVAVRGLLLFSLGPRLFRRASLPVQFLGGIGLVITLFPFSPPPFGRGAAALWTSPPAWFLGLYEVITLPAMRHAKSRLQPWQMNAERLAQQTYAGYEPLFHQLALVALVALAIAFVVGLSLYFATHFRHTSHLRQLAASQAARPRGSRLQFAGLAARFIVPDPVARATFFFVLQTLSRSVRHKFYVAGYLAVGALLTYATVMPLFVRQSPTLFDGPVMPLLSVQLVLSFFLLVGLRAAFAIPAELRANWVFRLITPDEPARVMTGVRRAVCIGVVLPFLVLLLPVHTAFWGAGVGLLHAAYGLLCSCVLMEVLLLSLHKVPFTCTHVSGNGHLRIFWPAYVAGFAVYSYWLAALEYRALTIGSVRPAVVLAVTLGALVLYRTRSAGLRTRLVFDEVPDSAAITLEL